MALSEMPTQAPTLAPVRGLPGTRALARNDIAGGLRLSDAAGWNQIDDDWSIFIEHGHALGACDAAGRLIATTAALPYGAAAGWVSMVLVDPAWRHRGLASALVREAVAFLQARGVSPMLDATGEGAVVYRGLGFAEGMTFDRWQVDQAAASVEAGRRINRVETNTSATGSDIVREGDADDGGLIASLDRDAGGLDRKFLIDRMLARPHTRCWISSDDRGFVVARRGRRATQVGPLVAADGRAAVALLGTALAASAGSIYIDVPTSRREIAAWLVASGFVRQRSFVRMSLGAARPPEVDAACHALAGPEFG